jgi:hypothetical protein
MLKPVLHQVPIYLGLGAYGHGTCLHYIQFMVIECMLGNRMIGVSVQ